MDINKNSEIPIYEQLKSYIREQIDRGSLRPGSRVMSESEASDLFGVSRITVRKAYGELVDEGVLVRKKGKGTFIKDIHFRENLAATSFTSTCLKLGMTPSSKVVEVGYVPAAEKHATIGAAPGEPVAYMGRLRYADDIPVRFERNYYAKPYEGIIHEDLAGSINLILHDKYNVLKTKQVFTIEIGYAEAAESKLLGTKRNAPLLKVNGTLLDQNGDPVYLTEMLHLPDRCILEI